MTHRYASRLIACLLIAGCGADTPAGTIEVPDGDNGVVLEITVEGGFAPVEFLLRTTPRYVVFNDGTVVSSSLNPDASNSAFNELTRFEIDEDVLGVLMTLIGDSAIAETDRIEIDDAPNVADASTTTLRYFDDAGEHRLSVYALGFEGGTDARSLILQSMIRALDEASASATHTSYVADRLELFAGPAPEFPQLTTERPWPPGIEPAEMVANAFGQYSCISLEGDDALDAMDMLTDGRTTGWVRDGTIYSLVARPLLPHQTGC